MSPIMLFRLQDARIRLLEEAVESRKREHEDSALVLDTEDLVAGCLSCWEDIRRSWVRTRRLAALNRLGDIEEVGATVLELLGRFMSLLGNVATLVEKVAEKTAWPVEGRENLLEARRETAELSEHVKSAWPWENRPILPLDRKMAEASRQARTRGEARDVADIVADLRSNVPVPQG